MRGRAGFVAAAAALIVLALCGFWFLRPVPGGGAAQGGRPREDGALQGQPGSSAPASLPPARPELGATASLPVPARSANPPAASAPVSQGVAESAVAEVRFVLRDYRAVLGENPVGTNAEIMAALLGMNSRQLKLRVPPGNTLNAAGELADPWGTPYFFHQLSGQEMEIRSAGPDRTMWTADDVVVK